MDKAEMNTAVTIEYRHDFYQTTHHRPTFISTGRENGITGQSHDSVNGAAALTETGEPVCPSGKALSW